MYDLFIYFNGLTRKPPFDEFVHVAQVHVLAGVQRKGLGDHVPGNGEQREELDGAQVQRLCEAHGEVLRAECRHHGRVFGQRWQK